MPNIEKPSSHYPLVSVYIPTKDRSDLLDRAVQSVLRQTYPRIQIIISDDGSTDDTSVRVQNWKAKHKQIIYLRSDISRGACYARNIAIRSATGYFITSLDDDDVFEPNRIESFVHHYKEGSNFLCALLHSFDGKKSTPSRYWQPHISFPGILSRNTIGGPVFLKRSDLIDNNLFFDEQFPAWQDYDYVTQLALHLGPATRVYKYTYIVYTNHDMGRVTNPKRILTGYRLYRTKYAKWMSPAQRASLAVSASLLSGHQVPRKLVRLCIRHFNLWDLVRVIRSRKRSNS